MEKEILGKTLAGEDIIAYTLSNKNGMSAKIMNYGANLLTLNVPDKNGNVADVVLGYEKIEDYFKNDPGFGCCVTPVANRIGGAKFTLNGVEYQLDVNDNENNLHSGFSPMHRTIWTLVNVSEQEISFTAHKKDMDMGFPGNMDITITYTLSDDNKISIKYDAVSDKDTIFNPTNHSYFNLAGHDSGLVLDQKVWLDADTFTVTTNHLIPTGEIASVKGTPLDFTTEKPLSDGIDDTSFEPIKFAGGFDHNFILNAPSLSTPVATLSDEKSGRKMEVFTDLPGMQLYSGNFISDGEMGKGNFGYHKRYGVCFESQFYPNAINVPSFPQPVIKAGQKFTTTTAYKFV